MREFNHKKTGYIACIIIACVLVVMIPVSAADNNTTVMMSGQNIDAIKAYNLGADLAAQGKFQEALTETENALSHPAEFYPGTDPESGNTQCYG